MLVSNRRRGIEVAFVLHRVIKGTLWGNKVVDIDKVWLRLKVAGLEFV